MANIKTIVSQTTFISSCLIELCRIYEKPVWFTCRFFKPSRNLRVFLNLTCEFNLNVVMLDFFIRTGIDGFKKQFSYRRGFKPVSARAEGMPWDSETPAINILFSLRRCSSGEQTGRRSYTGTMRSMPSDSEIPAMSTGWVSD